MQVQGKHEEDYGVAGAEADDMLRPIFYQCGNVSGQQRYMKPAYQATRDGVEGKEAVQDKGSLN